MTTKTATQSIGVPSVKGMQSAFGDFAMGAAGGLAYSLATGIFGNGLIGALAAPVLAGSVVKGARGTALATVAGFLLLSGVLGGASSGAQARGQANTRGVM
ncbi:hypothetical protein KKF61_06995 [Patescibacteria group bacterium]|nr:hypothetical protein [Patescibacteria group bacterium]